MLCQLLSLLLALASTAPSLTTRPTSDLSPIHHPANLTSPPTPNAAPSPNREAHCLANRGPILHRRPRFTDCGAAIRKLPSNHIIGTFHSIGADDQFRLPVTETSGSCRAEVKMGRLDEDSGTWFAIGMAATQLNMACVNAFTFPVKIGGWTTAGRGKRINVTLAYSGTREGLGGL